VEGLKRKSAESKLKMWVRLGSGHRRSGFYKGLYARPTQAHWSNPQSGRNRWLSLAHYLSLSLSLPGSEVSSYLIVLLKGLLYCNWTACHFHPLSHTRGGGLATAEEDCQINGEPIKKVTRDTAMYCYSIGGNQMICCWVIIFNFSIKTMSRCFGA